MPNPKRCDQRPRSSAAKPSRPRFACVPLNKCETLRPKMAERENSSVVKTAASIDGAVWSVDRGCEAKKMHANFLTANSREETRIRRQKNLRAHEDKSAVNKL